MMPEGPEVRSLTDRMRHRYSGGRWEIRSADLLSGRYKEGKPPDNWQQLQEALPVAVADVRCKGKFIYFQLAGAQELSCWSTLGMTGGWTLRPHRHARFSLTLVPTAAGRAAGAGDAAETLFYYDMRNFGTFKVCVDPALLQGKLKSLGPAWLPLSPAHDSAYVAASEALGEDLLDEDAFVAIGTAAAKRSPARALAVFLMDQSQTSGIGNYILSEVLFESRTWPWAVLGAVDDARWRALFRATVRVVAQSYEAQAVEQRSSSRGSSNQEESPQLPYPPARLTPSVAVDEVDQNKARGNRGCGTVRPAQPLTPPGAGSTVGAAAGGASAITAMVDAAIPPGDASGAAIGKQGGVRSLAPGGFVLQVYGKQLVVVEDEGRAAAPLVYEVRQSLGAHKRTVHWAPALQTGAKKESNIKKFAAAATPGGTEDADTEEGPAWALRTVEQLKVICRARGLKVTGRKAELVARLDSQRKKNTELTVK
jgi:formamidopyrimidine-DNA glycosylase